MHQIRMMCSTPSCALPNTILKSSPYNTSVALEQHLLREKIPLKHSIVESLARRRLFRRQVRCLEATYDRNSQSLHELHLQTIQLLTSAVTHVFQWNHICPIVSFGSNVELECIARVPAQVYIGKVSLQGLEKLLHCTNVVAGKR